MITPDPIGKSDLPWEDGPGYHTLNLRKPEIDQTIILLSIMKQNLPFSESLLNPF